MLGLCALDVPSFQVQLTAPAGHAAGPSSAMTGLKHCVGAAEGA